MVDLYYEDVCSRFIRNVDNLLPVYTVLNLENPNIYFPCFFLSEEMEEYKAEVM
jgi:hypothetical protein